MTKRKCRIKRERRRRRFSNWREEEEKNNQKKLKGVRDLSLALSTV